MKWVTYRGSQDGSAERTGVLSGETIHAMPQGVTLRVDAQVDGHALRRVLGVLGSR